jgi:predicted unusual protein kinase regulating ubiquinone biosynthesis (AarF/ABC1/UbiB family)
MMLASGTCPLVGRGRLPQLSQPAKGTIAKTNAYASTRRRRGVLKVRAVLRSLRALIMFWTIFASYAWGWLIDKWVSANKRDAHWDRVHSRNAHRLAHGFMRLRGVFIKLGQVLSVLGGFLPKAYGRELEQLHDSVPPHNFREIHKRLVEAFGPDALDRFKKLDEEPLAAASLAQVHHAVLPNGREVAVKVLYPGVDALIRRDLGVLRSVEPIFRRWFGLVHMRRVLEQLSDMLSRETDYANERANLERMQKLFADRDDIVVPEVIGEHCNGGVLTMSYEPGIKITDFAGYEDQDIDREGVAKLLVDAYFTMLFSERVFHADPHPGNFLVRPGPELVILDYGAVENVTESLADGMKTVVMGAMMKNDEQILSGVERMGFVADDGDRKLLGEVGRSYLKVLANVNIEDFSRLDHDTVKKLSGFDQTRGRIREIMRNIHYPDGFFYVERTLILLFGLVGRISPSTGLPGLVGPFAMQAFAKDLMPMMTGAQSPS